MKERVTRGVPHHTGGSRHPANVRILTDEEVQALLAVEETNVRIQFRVACSAFSITLDELSAGVGESVFDTFARCVTLERAFEIPFGTFCAKIISLADKHNRPVPETLTAMLHRYATSTARDKREAIDVIVATILGLVRAGFTLSATGIGSPRQLLAYDPRNGRYHGDRRIEQYLTVPAPPPIDRFS